mmetsp:Transcript_17486/g.20100  ORF Transcript_17486/g.20100 Transcript_17486/m.20100 type:complete len:482 (-) Transcript_17486:695-2140(-)
MVEESQVISRYKAAGQEHVLRHLGTLSVGEKEKFLKQLDSIKVEELSGLLESALAGQKEDDKDDIHNITPFSKHVGRTTDQAYSVSYEKGMEVIARSEVAALVLAGGQGTRLGFDGPKGMYDIGLPSGRGRTLFQILAERLKKLQEIASDHNIQDSSPGSKTLCTCPFYIMTSPINHEQTITYFKENNYFELPEDNVRFFQQGMLPCMTIEGKIIMETASKIAMAPDGNGGIYPSLQNSGMFDEMTDRGIKYLHVFSIDNALTKIADPAFIGYCIKQNSDCGNKVVWKTGPHEKVGVIAEKAGKPCIVEYSEITPQMSERTDADGRLVFGAGNICNHFYTLDFLRDKVMPNLANLYHIARKKIPYYDKATKTTIKPEVNNGIKLESFIFDIFPLSERMGVLDALRDQEFAPVKNAPGSLSDSPDTARAYLSKQAQQWVVDAGGILTGDLDTLCEISPLTSYGGEGLEEIVQGKDIHCPFSF